MTAPDEVRRAAEAALDKMASEVVILDVRQLASFTDFFLLASGSNPKQLVAIADSVRDALRALGLRPAHVEGYPRQEWMLMDYDWFVVHLFSDKSRSFYDLERLWGDAGRLEVSS